MSPLSSGRGFVEIAAKYAGQEFVVGWIEIAEQAPGSVEGIRSWIRFQAPDRKRAQPTGPGAYVSDYDILYMGALYLTQKMWGGPGDSSTVE